MGMTNVGYPLRVGGAVSGTQNSGLPGAVATPILVVSFAPATQQAANLAALQTVSGANFTLAAGTSVTTTTINGRTAYVLDVNRNLRATGGSVSTAAVLITVSGLDGYMQPVTQTFTGPAGTAVTATTKAFRYIFGASAAGNTVSTVSIGTGDVIGFPYAVRKLGQAQIWWDIAAVTTSVGITLADTATATATTGDVRGTYSLLSASDGSKQLTIYVPSLNPESTVQIYGVTQA